MDSGNGEFMVAVIHTVTYSFIWKVSHGAKGVTGGEEDIWA